jgi:predicted amidophosphoribosyltransferase
MDRRSLRERGFNPAVEIARVIGRKLSISTDVKRVVKVRQTPPQSTLAAQQRTRIRSGVFQCIAPTTERLIAVVDDVVTSTETARAVAGCLCTDNNTSVVVWAIARAKSSRAF